MTIQLLIKSLRSGDEWTEEGKLTAQTIVERELIEPLKMVGYRDPKLATIEVVKIVNPDSVDD